MADTQSQPKIASAALADEIEQQIPDNRDWITVQFPAYQRAEIVAALCSSAPSLEAMLEARLDGNRPLPFGRDELGRLVREAWVRWAQTQSKPKPSWLVPYDELAEPDKEADRQIGETIARWTLIGDASSAALSPQIASAGGGGAAESQDPVMWVCLVPGPAPAGGEVRIRAWTADRKRMESLRAEGVDMQPLYAGVAQAPPLPDRTMLARIIKAAMVGAHTGRIWRPEEIGFAEIYDRDFLAAADAVLSSVSSAQAPAQPSLPYLTDRELYDNSCITRFQLKNWIDSDYEKHVAGLKHTIEFLLARLDAASPVSSAQAPAQPSGGETVNFNGRLVTWAEIERAVRDRNADNDMIDPDSGRPFLNVLRSPAPAQAAPKWRHLKRGSIVTEIARGFAQVAHHPIEEMTAVVIYRHDADGRYWVRNAVEFDDGRFEPYPLSSTNRPCPEDDHGGSYTMGGQTSTERKWDEPDYEGCGVDTKRAVDRFDAERAALPSPVRGGGK